MYAWLVQSGWYHGAYSIKADCSSLFLVIRAQLCLAVRYVELIHRLQYVSGWPHRTHTHSSCQHTLQYYPAQYEYIPFLKYHNIGTLNCMVMMMIWLLVDYVAIAQKNLAWRTKQKILYNKSALCLLFASQPIGTRERKAHGGRRRSSHARV